MFAVCSCVVWCVCVCRFGNNLSIRYFIFFILTYFLFLQHSTFFRRKFCSLLRKRSAEENIKRGKNTHTHTRVVHLCVSFLALCVGSATPFRFATVTYTFLWSLALSTSVCVYCICHFGRRLFWLRVKTFPTPRPSQRKKKGIKKNKTKTAGRRILGMGNIRHTHTRTCRLMRCVERWKRTTRMFAAHKQYKQKNRIENRMTSTKKKGKKNNS